MPVYRVQNLVPLLHFIMFSCTLGHHRRHVIMFYLPMTPSVTDVNKKLQQTENHLEINQNAILGTRQTKRLLFTQSRCNPPNR